MAVFGAIGTALVAIGALLIGVAPAQAANIAAQPDTQIAVFMVPLTLLLLALLFEVARFVWRGPVPAQIATRPARQTDWATQDSQR